MRWVFALLMRLRIYPNLTRVCFTLTSAVDDSEGAMTGAPAMSPSQKFAELFRKAAAAAGKQK
jgi:hypothetical protein